VRQFGDRVTVFTSDCYNAGGFVQPGAPRISAGWEEIKGVHVHRFRVLNRFGPILKPVQWLAFKLHLPFNEYLRVWYSGPHIPGLAESIRKSQAGIIAAASFPLLHMFTTLKSGRQSERPVVLIGNQHPGDAWGFNRPMIATAIRQADAYIANTDYEAHYVIENGASPDRVFTIGCGVDAERFLETDQMAARFRLNLPKDIPVVGFIGQLGRYKGIDTLLRAMPKVWQSIPQVGLLIAGAQTNFQSHIESILNQYPSEYRHRIHFRYNFKEAEKQDLFAALDIFAYPSGYESFGIAYLEAWASGKVVIGCRRGAVPWVIQHEKDGLLVGYQDQDALASALIQLLQNKDRARAMGEFGRRKVLARYTWPIVARQYQDIYTQTMRSFRPV
jgi:glycosyltransferase involved in cell wall biosynthesis